MHSKPSPRLPNPRKNGLSPLISRKDRLDAANLITALLNNKLDHTHAEIFERVCRSDDTTVRHACEILTDYSEEAGNSAADWEKADWDHLERIRLVLHSDAEMQRESRCRFGQQQWLCCLGLTAFIAFVMLTGTGWHLVIGTAILGILTLACGWLPPAEVSSHPYQPIIEPFTSIGQLASVYKSSPSFRKDRFRGDRWEGPNRWGQLMWLAVGAVAMMVFSPMILLLMAVPDCESNHQVVCESS